MSIESTPNALINKSPLALNELAESSLEIAQQSQLSAVLADKGLEDLSKEIGTGKQLVALDAPEVNENSLDFFSTMILALSRLSSMLGDMADSTIIELQFKRDEIKELLKEKLETIKETEQRRKDQIEAQRAMERNQKRSGIFGSVMNFVFAAAEIVGGAFVVAAGVASGNPAMIAGGASIVTSGLLQATAEIVSLAGNDKAADKIRIAADVFLYAGLALSFMGALSTTVAAAKQGAKEVAKEGVERAVKEGAEKAVKEGAEQAIKEGAEKGVKEAAKESAETAAQKQTKRHMANAAKSLSAGASISAGGNQIFQSVGKLQENAYQVRAAELEAEITKLGAKLESIIAEQEYVNQLIQLLQEQWTTAVVGPIEAAFETLGAAIQDRGGVSKRIAASMSA